MASLVKRPGSTIWYIQYQSQGKWKRVSTKTDKKENRPGSPEPLQGGRGQGIQRPPHPTQTAHPGRTGGPIPGPLRGHHGPAVGPQQTLAARQVPAAVFG